MLRTDPERTLKVAEALLDWYNGPHDGLLSGAELPESETPKGVIRGSYEHILFLTLSVSIDYQRSAQQLWDAARETWLDEATRWVFFPSEVGKRGEIELREALGKHKLSKKPFRDAAIWRTVALSFLELFQGDPRVLFEQHNNNAHAVFGAMKSRYGKRFPYLAGSTGTQKILSLWLRMLKDEAGYPFDDIHKVPLPVDIHTARSSLTLGCLFGDFRGRFDEIASLVKAGWKEAFEGSERYPLQIDEPLWNLSRYGCTFRKTGEKCPMRYDCRVAEYCTVAEEPSAVLDLDQNNICKVSTKVR
jgi:hypothetical protein